MKLKSTDLPEMLLYKWTLLQYQSLLTAVMLSHWTHVHIFIVTADVPEQNSLEKLLVSFCVAWPVLLNFLIQKVLQCESVFSPIQVCNLWKEQKSQVSPATIKVSGNLHDGPRVCVRPVAGGYPGSLCLMARDHPSATSGSARASCKAWEPAGGRGALGAACAELRSSSAYCSRWWLVETSSVRGRRLRVQVPVSGSEPSYLRRFKTHRLMLHILTDLSKSRLRKTVCSLFTSYDETLVLW